MKVRTIAYLQTYLVWLLELTSFLKKNVENFDYCLLLRCGLTLEPSLKKYSFLTKILQIIDIGKIRRQKGGKTLNLFIKTEGRVTRLTVSRPFWDFPHHRSEFK